MQFHFTVNFVHRSDLHERFHTHTDTQHVIFFFQYKKSWEKNLSAESIVQLTVSFETFINDGQGTSKVESCFESQKSLIQVYEMT